jgi:hypothetical protein
MDYTYNYSYTYTPSPYKYDVTSTGTTYPYFSSYGTYDYTTYTYKAFEVKPKVVNGSGECSYYGIQAGTAGGALMGMCDGSVKTISSGIAIRTWQALGSPNSGDIPGSDW